jgi:hypothetical protein
MSDRYFKLKDHIGVEPDLIEEDGQPVENPKAGELQPLVEVGLKVEVPTIVQGKVASATDSVTLKPIPGTRILKVNKAAHANGLLQSGNWDEVDPPDEKALKDARGETAASREVK